MENIVDLAMKKRIAICGLSLGVLALSVSGTAIAKGHQDKGAKAMPGQAMGKGPAEKATGGVGYEAGDLYREMEFNAHEQKDHYCEAQWQVEGDWVLSLELGTDTYDHDMTVSDQDEDGNLAGSGGYPSGNPYTKSWTLTDSYVQGDDIWLGLDYNNSGYTATLDGTIGEDGSLEGEWLDTNNNSGNWTSTDGSAAQLALGCKGKGMLHYSDEDGSWYDVEIHYVNVEGNMAWFAGPIVAASNSDWTERWFFGKALDGGEPAAGEDQVWGSFTSMEDAKIGVADMDNPRSGPFPVDMGNLQVHAN